MKNSLFLLSALTLLAASCGSSGEDSSEKEQQKAELLTQLAEKEGALQTLEDEIETIEAEIVALDPSYKAFERNARLVTAIAAEKGLFEHFVQARGNVASNTNVTLTAEAGGTVTSVPVKEGQFVRKGATLVRIDAAILRSSIAEIRENLKLADTLYAKQKRLWEQGVGTEVQFLQAQSQVESLKARLQSTQAQLSLSTVTAPFSGRIDAVLINSGQQAAPGMPMVRLVGDRDMYLEADLSENYIGSFKGGDAVEVNFPSINTMRASRISSVGEVINPLNRTFTVEVSLPAVENLRPNMLAVLKLKDYSSDVAVTVPSMLIQTDRTSDFVFVIDENENGQTIAKKVRVERGYNYEGRTEIVDGLNGTEVLINEGFREVVDGSFVNDVTASQG
ncbi:MAG: efflux RND transporter periplasmic adaptor subunit [Bacteroidota bacterium]